MPLSGIFASEVSGSLSSGLSNGSTINGVQVVAPTASIATGTFHASQSVTLAAAESHSIRYTLTGVDPTCSSGTVYSTALTINTTTTLKAVSCYDVDDSIASSVSSYTYTFTCSTSSVSNGSVGSYPGCAISCNSGYTLNGSTCESSGGGGGGGGGGGYYPSTTTTATTTTTVAPVTIPGLILPYSNPIITAEINANRTALINYIITLLTARQNTTNVAGIPSGFQFVNTLSFGSSGNDVKYLQIFLNSDPSTSIGNSGQETTYFGSMTKAAVGKFQIKYGLVSGTSDPGYGIVGPKTRAKINSLL